MTPTLDDILDRSHVVSLPMRVKFRGIMTREALLIDGPAGWGEFSPFLEYPAPEAAAWLAAGLEAAFTGLPAPRVPRVAVNATVPAVPAARVPEVLARYPGCTTVKVKVAEPGQELADDIARVTAVRTHIPGARIRVDANRGWTVAEAVRAAHALGPLDYLEQPCATVEELGEVRRHVAGLTRVAADESIRRADDPYRVARAGVAQVAVVKVAPLGGVRRLLRIAAFARERGMELTVASALDTAVGMNAGLVAAANAGSAPAGLATGGLFEVDVAAPRTLVDGHLSTAAVVPDPERLAAVKAAPARREWWFNRLAEAYAELRSAAHLELRAEVEE